MVFLIYRHIDHHIQIYLYEEIEIKKDKLQCDDLLIARRLFESERKTCQSCRGRESLS